MRVDWTKNLVETPDWDDMFIGKVFGSIKLTGVAYAVSDPDSPDAPSFRRGSGLLRRDLEVLRRGRREPFLPRGPALRRGRALHRLGLVRVRPAGGDGPELVPAHRSGRRLRAARAHDRAARTSSATPPASTSAAFWSASPRPGQQGWDPGYGFTDALHHRFAHVHNIWKRSHIETACETNDDIDANGTADACEAAVTGYDKSAGSQCDVFTKKCTIPVPRSRDQDGRLLGQQGVPGGAPGSGRRQGQPDRPRRRRGHHLLVEPAALERGGGRARGRVPPYRRRPPGVPRRSSSTATRCSATARGSSARSRRPSRS